VGYAGGEKVRNAGHNRSQLVTLQANPTYYSLGDHTETIDVDYDPEVTNYEAMLRLFWKNHDPTK